jgi:pyridoxine 4-dehydrogenase
LSQPSRRRRKHWLGKGGSIALGRGDAAGGGMLGRVARRLGATPVQVVIAWLLARSPVIVPIPETSSLVCTENQILE